MVMCSVTYHTNLFPITIEVVIVVTIDILLFFFWAGHWSTEASWWQFPGATVGWRATTTPTAWTATLLDQWVFQHSDSLLPMQHSQALTPHRASVQYCVLCRPDMTADIFSIHSSSREMNIDRWSSACHTQVALGLVQSKATYIIWPPRRWSRIESFLPENRRPVDLNELEELENLVVADTENRTETKRPDELIESPLPPEKIGPVNSLWDSQHFMILDYFSWQNTYASLAYFINTRTIIIVSLKKKEMNLLYGLFHNGILWVHWH